ncbi:hypothetical protein CTEN210_00638 [Chaetoceros tenuissimus]|uniref:Trimethylguanosine synthase n=1 Tax=Chaetoceros tenuissimus TaxID=426638 RepID=A0AAD3GZB6_9STRA|nr:hypothetical protein CTEN210_00638 [Chaetoceros tenuissimus]
MGKKNKSKGAIPKKQKGKQKFKFNKHHKKRDKLWIEKCKTHRVNDKFRSIHLILPLLITRVELTDDHMHAGKCIKDVVVEEEVQVQDETTDKINQDEDEKGLKLTADLPTKEAESKTDTNKKEIEENKEAKDPFIQIIKSPSAKGNVKIVDLGVKELPNGDCGDGIVNPYDKQDVPDKYWAQRKRLFSKYDSGIELDNESWYSVTPEAIATHIAKRISRLGKKKTDLVVLDPFCGVGGNGIAFSLHSDISLVVCVDVDKNKLKMAANNASKYGVDPSKILFIHDNACGVLQQYQDGALRKEKDNSSKMVESEEHCGYRISTGIDALPSTIDHIFLSPPWGGISYLDVGKTGYDMTNIKITLSDEKKLNGDDLLGMAANAAKDGNVVYFLPKNTNGFNLGISAWKKGYRRMEMEQNYLNGKLKTITSYLCRK